MNEILGYKPSKYNYVVESRKDGSLLMYNSITGTPSLVCVKEGNRKEQIMKLLQQEQISKEESANYEKLIEKGFLVDQELNEHRVLKNKIMSEVMEPVLRLTILPTEDCNFRCKYCYETHEKGLMNEETQKGIIEYVRKNIMKYTAVSVAWFGGEPLEGLEVIEHISLKLIQICKTAKRTYSAGMTTNAYNLTYEVFERLIRCKIYDYQVTLDGVQKVHDSLRVLKGGAPTFDRIVLNLKTIKEKSKNPFFTFALRTNFTLAAIHELEPYLEFYRENFGDDKRFRIFPFFMQKWSDDFDETIASEVVDKKDKRKFYDTLAQYNEFIDLDMYLNFLSSSGLCAAAFKNAYVIGSDGLVYKCTEDFVSPENYLGSLDGQGHMRLNHQKVNQWMDASIQDHCLDCFFAGACQGRSCPKHRIKTEGRCNVPIEKLNMDIILEMIRRNNFETIGN